MIEKKFKSLTSILLGLGCMIFLLGSCKKTNEETPVIIADPTVTSSAATWVSQTFATLNGIILANNSTVLASFEYGTSMEYGLSLKAKPDTVTGIKNISVYVNLTHLLPNTTYHFRVKGEGSFGILYGDDVTFTTLEPKESNIVFNPDVVYGSVSDNDGNVYKTVQIGAQTWMAENLKTTLYNDDTAIPLVNQNTEWGALSTPGYCWYNNDTVSYGILYNWYTVNTGKLCPTGWHVPADNDWDDLAASIGGDTNGFRLKEAGEIHWLTPNTGATNESGFTALPGGYRANLSGSFNNLRRIAYFWSSTELNTVDANYRMLSYNYSQLDKSSSSKSSGFSVRCVKDN